MKPLERIFFVACINTISENIYMHHMVKMFGAFGFSEKQLYRYVEKWDDKGFYDYGVSMRVGWFEFDKLVGEYKVLYDKYYKGCDK